MKHLIQYIKESLLDDEDTIVNRESHLDYDLRITPYNFLYEILTDEEQKVNEYCLRLIAGLFKELKFKHIKRETNIKDIKPLRYRFNANDNGIFVNGKNNTIIKVKPYILNRQNIFYIIETQTVKGIILNSRSFEARYNGMLNEETYDKLKNYIKSVIA